MIRIYTDGAWRKKEKAAGAGAVIIWDNGHISTYHEFLGDVTNNCAELRAIKLGLSKILRSYALRRSKKKNGHNAITVYSDSTYAIGILTKDWKAKANKELIAEIKQIIDEFDDLKFIWVKGHSKDKYNRLADLLANIAIDQHFGRDEKYSITVKVVKEKEEL